MPYASNQNLPESVRNSLPAAAQSIFRNAFNSSFDKDNDEEKANKIGWGAVKNAGWAKEGDTWKKINSELKDIEIFSVGMHGGENFTEADLDEMANNFVALKDYVKPVFKLAHKNKMHLKDGQPALGWASEVKRVGKKLIASFTDVPETIKKAISRKLYKRVSSEIYNGLNIGGKKYKRVLAGVGLLGADIPEVKDLKDIEMFFADDNLSSSAISTYTMDVSDGIITMEVDNMSEELKKTFEERLKLIEETHAAEIKKFTEQREADLQKFTEERDKLIADKNKEIEALKTANIKRESENKIAAFKIYCEDMVKAGKMIPAARDILIADIDKMEFTEEGQDIVITFDKFKAYMDKTILEILDKGEHGRHIPIGKREKTGLKRYSAKPGAVFENIDLDVEATKYAREHKVEYAEALAIVMEENTALADQFSEAGFFSREED